MSNYSEEHKEFQKEFNYYYEKIWRDLDVKL